MIIVQYASWLWSELELKIFINKWQNDGILKEK